MRFGSWCWRAGAGAGLTRLAVCGVEMTATTAVAAQRYPNIWKDDPKIWGWPPTYGLQQLELPKI